MSNRIYSTRRRNPGWLKKLFKRIGDFRFFLSLKQGVVESWKKSDRTI